MSRNSVLIPEAKKAMDSFKSEVANSLNVNLKQGDNGDLTSRQAGSIGGEMVKRMIAYAANNMNKYKSYKVYKAGNGRKISGYFY